MKPNLKRAIAIVVCVSILLAMGLSLAVMNSRSNHVCTDGSCRFCAEYEFAQMVIRQFSDTLVLDLLVLVLLAVLVAYFAGMLCEAGSGVTPVSLKVRMNR